MWDAHVARCLDGLSAPARRLVEVGAVFGSSFTIADAAEVLGQPVGSLMAAVEEAVDTGALLLTPVALAFRHDGIRCVAYDVVLSALVTALRRQIGELLLPPPRVGGGGRPPDAWFHGG
jgi:hypothetical protein